MKQGQMRAQKSTAGVIHVSPACLGPAVTAVKIGFYNAASLVGIEDINVAFDKGLIGLGVFQ